MLSPFGGQAWPLSAFNCACLTHIKAEGWVVFVRAEANERWKAPGGGSQTKGGQGTERIPLMEEGRGGQPKMYIRLADHTPRSARSPTRSQTSQPPPSFAPIPTNPPLSPFLPFVYPPCPPPAGVWSPGQQLLSWSWRQPRNERGKPAGAARRASCGNGSHTSIGERGERGRVLVITPCLVGNPCDALLLANQTSTRQKEAKSAPRRMHALSSSSHPPTSRTLHDAGGGGRANGGRRAAGQVHPDLLLAQQPCGWMMQDAGNG